MKKLFALLCVVPLLASCVAPTIKDKNIAMMIDETPVSMDEYIYNYNYMTDYFIDETNKTKDNLTEKELEMIAEKAKFQILFMHSIKKLATDNNITLSDDDNEYIKNKINDEIQLFGGAETFNETLKSIGLTMEKYQETNESGILYGKLSKLYFGDDSKNPINEESLKKSFKTDYYRVKHILINKAEDGHSADDGHGHTDLMGDEDAKLLTQDVLSKLQESEDFDKLMNEYGQDPGVARNPDGYHFKKGEAVAEFEKASLALKDNEISDIIETDFGYHIIKRLPLDENYFSETKGELIEKATDEAMDKLIDDTISSFNIRLNNMLKDITPANSQSYISK